MLISPLLVGALAGGFSWVHLPLAAFWLSGYFAFFATSLWLKTRRMPRHFPPVRTYVLLSTVFGIIVLLIQPALIRWAPMFVLPLAIGLWASAHRNERALIAGVATLAGSALMTVVAYDAGTGIDLHRAWLLALAQFLYFGGTVFYVKTIIRERENLGFYWLSVGYHFVSLLIIIAVFGLSTHGIPLAAVYFALLVRAAVVPKFNVTPKQIGIAEIFSTTAVALASLYA